MNKKLLERVLSVKDRFIEHLWATTTPNPHPNDPRVQNTLTKEECVLMDDIIELEESVREED
jgi:hypothetical protein